LNQQKEIYGRDEVKEEEMEVEMRW